MTEARGPWLDGLRGEGHAKEVLVSGGAYV